MKLYVNRTTGEWVATKREAKKINAREIDIKRDKQNLLEFFNTEKVGKQTDQVEVNYDGSEELLSSHASSWVNWALETLNRGDVKEAKAMLERGLGIEFKIKKANVGGA